MSEPQEEKGQRNESKTTNDMRLITSFQAPPYVGQISYSLGTDRFDNLPVQTTAASWDLFWEAIKANQSPVKGQGWFCPAMGKGLNRKSKKYKGEANWRQAHLAQPTPFLALDVDGMPSTMLQPLLNFIHGFSGCSYTTASFTDENPRLRVVIGLSRLVDYSERIRIGLAFERLVGAQGVKGLKFDRSVYSSAQPCYLPLTGASYIKHDGELALNPDNLLSSEYSKPEDANGSNPSEAVDGLFNDMPLDDQRELVAEIEAKRGRIRESARAVNWNYDAPEVTALKKELHSLTAGLTQCWQHTDASLEAFCNELTKVDVNTLTRSQWVAQVLLAARAAPAGSTEAEAIKAKLQAWSEKHICYAEHFAHGNESPEFEAFGGKGDPFADFEDRWTEGERSASISNSPFKKFSYMANNSLAVPQMIMADGSLRNIFEMNSTLTFKEDEPSTAGGKSSLSARSLSELFSDVELRQEDVDAMDDAEIIFPDLIVKGHVQAIVSPANGGKTTIMVYACEKLVEAGMEVYYINVDGSPGDLKRHHAHAQNHGYKVLAPDARQGGSIQSIHTKLQSLANGIPSLSNTVLIFDTLKKFVQVIDKTKAAAFFKLTRSLSVKGATVILLGHTNKHAGEDGQQVFEGTADLRNDVDELIYLDCYKNEAEGLLEVTTRPDKVRAVLNPKTFIIDLKNERRVSELGYTKNIVAKEKRLVLELFKEAIANGLHSQKDLLDYVEPKTAEGQAKLRKLLKEFTSWDLPEILAASTGRGKDLHYTIAGV